MKNMKPDLKKKKKVETGFSGVFVHIKLHFLYRLNQEMLQYFCEFYVFRIIYLFHLFPPSKSLEI